MTDCLTTGMAIAMNGKRLLVDNGDGRVKLLSHEIELFSLPLSDPGDIAVLSDIEAVATRNKSLAMLSILGGLMSITSTTTLCYGVTSHQQVQVLTFCNMYLTDRQTW